MQRDHDNRGMLALILDSLIGGPARRAHLGAEVRCAVRTTALALWLSIVLAGCSTAPGPRYYTLSADPPRRGNVLSSNLAGASTALYVVVLGPVTIPEFVDRPQLVVRVSETEVKIAESQRWAAPLDSEIPRVLAENLEHELHGARVVTSDQSGAVNADYRVTVDVRGFTSFLGTAATVDVDWTIQRSNGKGSTNGSARIREPALGGGYAALVAAYSSALERVAQDIAQSFRGLAASRPLSGHHSQSEASAAD